MITLDEVIAAIWGQGSECPERVAYVCYNGKSTYTVSDFLALSRKVMSKLASAGIGRGDVIAIRLGRGMEHDACRFAAISLGAVPLSIDPVIPDGRAKAVMAASSVSLTIDEGFFPLEECTEEVSPIKVPDDEPGFIIFTSGSSGMPKLIVHPRSTLSYFTDYYAAIGFGNDVEWCLDIVSVSFIISWLEFIDTLYWRVSHDILDDSVRGDIPSVRAFIRGNMNGLAVLNPSYLRVLGLDCGLRFVVVAGERPGRFPKCGIDIVNAYGSSEVIVGFGRQDGDQEMGIDHCVEGSEVFLIDDDGNASDEGEVVYHGAGIMTGYLGSIGKGARGSMKEYRTGDIGRRDGKCIRIIGRKDSMVKIRGQRVEPAETEHAIVSVPGVEDAVVKAFSDNGTYLCAYYISADVDEDRVRQGISGKLSSYQVPTYIKRFDSLPRNANGKVDRQSLQSLRMVAGTTAPPRDRREKMLCECMCQVLGVERMGIDDDFITFGGDSLKAVGMASLFAERIAASPELSGYVLKASQVLLLRTPRAIAENLSKIRDFKVDYTLETGAPLPDSLRNAELVVRELGEHYFCITFYISTKFWTDERQVAGFVRKVAEIVPAFRMRVTEKNGVPWMTFDGEPDIRFLDCAPKDADLHSIARFDEDDRLARFFVCRHDGFVSLIACLSHLIFDGHSAKPLFDRVVGLLSEEEMKPDLGLLAQSAYDEMLHGTGEYAVSKALFERSIMPVYGPVARMRSSEEEWDGRFYRPPMDVDPAALREFARETGVTITDVCAVAFGLAKAKVLGDRESYASLVSKGRSAPGTTGSVGMFTKIVPLHTAVEDMEIPEYLRKCSGMMENLIDHDEYPVWEAGCEAYPDVEMFFQYSDYIGSMASALPEGIEFGQLRGISYERMSTVMVVEKERKLSIIAAFSVRYDREQCRELLECTERFMGLLMSKDNVKELFE